MKVFHNSFINQQTEIFKSASKIAGEDEGLLNTSHTNAILKAMSDLDSDNVTLDKLIDLLKLITETRDDYDRKHSGALTTHPYVVALDRIKNNILDSIKISLPDLGKEYEEKFAELKSNISQAKKIKVKDEFCYPICCLWVTPQKIMSFNDCDRQYAPIVDEGELNWCAPIDTMRGLSAEWRSQNKIIETEAPIVHIMKRP